MVQPRLDFSKLIPAKAAMQAVQRFARELKINRDNGIRLRITGDVALEYEEMQNVSRGAVIAGIFALVLVGVVLFIGLGSPRLVLSTLVTLVMGLIWTAGFATAAVGHLNMISVAFGVLYIGLGVAG
ncbi:MAG: MMPL family transporter [Deltaproteobacteria bacterium]|nr:MMPL family transporter [Deltaproteobacteria bacterium]